MIPVIVLGVGALFGIGCTDPKFFPGASRDVSRDTYEPDSTSGDTGTTTNLDLPKCPLNEDGRVNQRDALGNQLTYGESCYTPITKCLGFAEDCVAPDGLVKLFCTTEGMELPTDDEEVCDGLDNDCDGTIDDFILPGAALCANAHPVDSPCYMQSPERCIDGIVQCPEISDGSEHASEEICDGVDNDCNGATDETFVDLGSPCSIPDPNTSCQLTGTIECADDGSTTCANATSNPQPEICDDIDNDCNGDLNDNIVMENDACVIEIEECTFPGQLTCDPKNAGPENNGLSCTSSELDAHPFGDEVCDGIDNDCDGIIDNAAGSMDPFSLTKTEPNGYNNVGECKDPEFVCGGINDANEPVWIPTSLSIEPTVEVCDGLDNDCNGFTDKHPDGSVLEKVCQYDAHCAGTMMCENGNFADCAPVAIAAIEICNGIDDDCDGTTDIDTTHGITQEGNIVAAGDECSNGEFGVCAQPGAYLCLAGAGYMACSAPAGGNLASTEVCDGLDNDCDGQTDIGATDIGEPCTAGEGPCATTAVTECSEGTIACGATPDLSQQTDEFCDHIDNDCSGVVDDIDCTPSCDIDIATMIASDIPATQNADQSINIEIVSGNATEAHFLLQNAETFLCNGLSPQIAPSPDAVAFTLGLAPGFTSSFACSVNGFGASADCPPIHVTVTSQPPEIEILTPTGKGNHPSGNGCTGIDPYLASWTAHDPENTLLTCQAHFLNAAGIEIAQSNAIQQNNGTFTAALPSTNVPEFALGLGIRVTCTDTDGVEASVTETWHSARQGTRLFVAAHNNLIADWSAHNNTMQVFGNPTVDPATQHMLFNGSTDTLRFPNVALQATQNTIQILTQGNPIVDADANSRQTIIEGISDIENDRVAMFYRAKHVRGFICPENTTCGSGSATKSVLPVNDGDSVTAQLLSDDENNHLLINNVIESSKALNPGTFASQYTWNIGHSDVVNPENNSFYQGSLAFAIVADPAAHAQCQ